MNLQKQIIIANKICNLCAKYNISWKMNLGGLTIYYDKSKNHGKWFPLASVSDAEELVLQIANTQSSNQSTLDMFA